ncbi:lysosomal-associated transmembrane protein 4B-like [Ctenocephalides felis]|uniref:lysosomal-associated transmembrane protein 4B-like n=1 Tax=Ctenocephalides felis TaxID=7515 RepID=UPI000E6E397C|nr:lysosomal-associated transmembrane protein 4B-like [Ctenocephalides felis]
MGALVTICTLAITLMMLYGAVKQKPAHILPFFCLQLFDFAITTLTATGYLCYLRSVHRLVSESRHLPMREELLKLSPQTLSLLVLVGFICVMLFKAYCIGVVWRCYKYLTMRQHALKTLLPYVIPDPTTTSNLDATLNPNDINATRTAMMMNCEPAYSSLLPDYEEAVKQSQDIPPSYQAAVASAGLIEKEAAASSADATEETNKPETEPAKTPEPETTTKSEPHNV